MEGVFSLDRFLETGIHTLLHLGVHRTIDIQLAVEVVVDRTGRESCFVGKCSVRCSIKAGVRELLPGRGQNSLSGSRQNLTPVAGPSLCLARDVTRTRVGDERPFAVFTPAWKDSGRPHRLGASKRMGRAMTGYQQRPVREERRPPREAVEEVRARRSADPTPHFSSGSRACELLCPGRSPRYRVDRSRSPGPRTWRSLKTKLASAGLPVNRVHTVVVTHSHPDHFGQAARFKSRIGAEIVTHRNFRTFLDPVDESDDEEILTVHEESVGPNQRPRVDGPLNRSTPWGGKPYQLPIARKFGYWAMKKAAGRLMATPAPTKKVEDAEILELGGREWVSVPYARSHSGPSLFVRPCQRDHDQR